MDFKDYFQIEINEPIKKDGNKKSTEKPANKTIPVFNVFTSKNKKTMVVVRKTSRTTSMLVASLNDNGMVLKIYQKGLWITANRDAIVTLLRGITTTKVDILWTQEVREGTKFADQLLYLHSISEDKKRNRLYSNGISYDYSYSSTIGRVYLNQHMESELIELEDNDFNKANDIINTIANDKFICDVMRGELSNRIVFLNSIMVGMQLGPDAALDYLYKSRPLRKNTIGHRGVHCISKLLIESNMKSGSVLSSSLKYDNEQDELLKVIEATPVFSTVDNIIRAEKIEIEFLADIGIGVKSQINLSSVMGEHPNEIEMLSEEREQIFRAKFLEAQRNWVTEEREDVTEEILKFSTGGFKTVKATSDDDFDNILMLKDYSCNEWTNAHWILYNDAKAVLVLFKVYDGYKGKMVQKKLIMKGDKNSVVAYEALSNKSLL